MRANVWFLLLTFMVAPLARAQTDGMQVIRGFAIDRHEVSIAQFGVYVQATGIVTAAEKAGGGMTYEGGWLQRKGWTWRTPYGLPANDKEPAVHLNFHEAKAYCQWAGKRLPSDAEWMEAAYTERRSEAPAGFATGRSYPYPTGESPLGANCLGDCGAAPTPAVYANASFTSRGRGHALTATTRAGVNGLWDMGANVWEWTDDGKAGSGAGFNVAQRPTRGGSWWYGAEQMHRDHLQTKPEDTAVVYVGFRCAANSRQK
jgi:formylglycine-generating enzyme required for sulfatase activity